MSYPPSPAAQLDLVRAQMNRLAIRCDLEAAYPLVVEDPVVDQDMAFPVEEPVVVEHSVGGIQHAAMNLPEIIEHILKFCHMEDIKSCRLVCKMWRDSSMPALQLRNSLKIRSVDKSGEKSMAGYLEALNAKMVLGLHDHAEVSLSSSSAGELQHFRRLTSMQSRRSPPTHRISPPPPLRPRQWQVMQQEPPQELPPPLPPRRPPALRASFESIPPFESYVNFPELSYDQFWITIGNQVKVLKLENCVFTSYSSFQKLLFQFCPNMVELCVSQVKVLQGSIEINIRPGLRNAADSENRNLKRLTTDDTIVVNTGVTWMKLFSHFPSLEALKLRDRMNGDHVEKIFQAINAVRQNDPSKLRLKRVHARYTSEHARSACHEDISASLLKTILATDKKLENLSITLNMDDAEASLAGILHLHGSSLKSLHLDRYIQGFLYPKMCIPHSIRNQTDKLLVNLQELKLHSRVFHTLSFLRFTPNLKRLKIMETNYEDGVEGSLIASSNDVNMSDVRLFKCTELELGGFVAVAEMKLLVSWLPHVEKLKTPLNNELLVVVCEGWPNIVSLDISESRVDEAGLVGLDAEFVNMINKHWHYGSRPMPATVQRPNISSLKYLQNLRIINGRPEIVPWPSFLNCAGHYGIRQLPLLNQVEIDEFMFISGFFLYTFHLRPGDGKVFVRAIGGVKKGLCTDIRCLCQTISGFV